jgi:hypothetical protein
MGLHSRQQKKPTWQNTLRVFDHVGLLIDEPSNLVGVPFV